MTTSLTPSRGIELVSPIRVLIAEDETHLGTILEQFMTARGFAVTIVRDGRAALERLRADTYDVALLDVVMPELDGLEVLRQVREEPMPPEIIVITGNGTIETAMAALRLGAYDFLSKPYRMAEIEALVRRAWEKRVLTRDNALLHSRLRRAVSEPHFVTQFAPLLAVLSVVERVAASASPVLVSGESGTGKDLLARVLHARSSRADGPFVGFNCALVADHLVETELFGVERGALPGADQRRIGLLEMAAGGTLYLDNVADLEPSVQAKLVRALDSASFHRIGGTQKVHLDVRVVASTTDSVRLAAEGEHRSDLLHRIGTIRVMLPPLRDRTVDVPLLARHFLEHFGAGSPPELTPDAVATLERYRWPGNVRELRNVIERGVLLAVDGVIGARDFPLGTDNDVIGAATPTTTPTAGLTLAALERQHIAEVLERSSWHQGKASEILGISPKTLYRKIREYGFRRPSGRGS
ncbi:MAG TPA: sigma-54 dependent transcriptional regulator [Gemmatimonas sp.]|nr:sigma-54 dependent transcriptional regulator [Gemmatimonas sp.]